MIKTPRYGLLLLLLTAWLIGCTTQSTVPPTTPDGQALPTRHLITTLPFFPQQAFQCGPAALATLLVFQDIDITPEELIDQVYLPARQGSLQIELLASARQRGLIPYPLETHQQLLQEVAAGHPVLVFQNLGLSLQPVWHFAVISGYDLEQRVFYLNSGTRQNHVTDFSTFHHTWQRGGNWAWLLLPPDQLPVSTELTTSLKAIHQLELAGQPEIAATAYQVSMLRWPEAPLPRLLLANIEYQLERPARVAELLNEALLLEPGLVAAWHNFGQVLTQHTECKAEAARALSCAARLQGREDTNLMEKQSHGNCPLKTPPACPAGD
ncbi:PA2778 family cysteine peptidase [Marinospirillum alkaliphilum]|uniref:Peptidase_C39 like family protein n=1 Tax=Marinospirillum alkaliphilum DSM 21637 TaxID=1122209 RepID=A0A1K1UHN9_9GAMM|nr:PA2778 family cysteine peptidase [Marinospirillum alkaliphilum]SFX11955.1 Peptidase_C39 like family protein [Marinospirillum alkaliphilum DSM 21637]